MNELAFAAATLPAPRRILRLSLLPYSVGHELILQAGQNPLLDSEDSFNKLTLKEQCGAIIRAVQVCSRTWAQNKRPDKWLKLWGWLIRNEDFALAIAEFRIYRMEGTLFPRFADSRFSKDTGDGRALGAPPAASLLNFAITRFDNPFDVPLGLLQFLYFSQMEFEGNCRIENATEREAREQFDKHESDILREQAEAKAKGDACQH